MKKTLLSSLLATLLVAGISTAANAATTASDSTTVNATLESAVTLSKSVVYTAPLTIDKDGNLSSQITGSYILKSNAERGVRVSLSAANNALGYVDGQVRLAFAKSDATPAAITNVFDANPSALSNKNVIAYPVTITGISIPKVAGVYRTPQSANISAGDYTIGFTVSTTPVPGTALFPTDLSGDYSATVNCDVTNL